MNSTSVSMQCSRYLPFHTMWIIYGIFLKNFSTLFCVLHERLHCNTSPGLIDSGSLPINNNDAVSHKESLVGLIRIALTLIRDQHRCDDVCSTWHLTVGSPSDLQLVLLISVLLLSIRKQIDILFNLDGL